MLPDKFVEKAKLELREDEKRKKQALEHFREWIQKHPYIKNIRQGKLNGSLQEACRRVDNSFNLQNCEIYVNLCKLQEYVWDWNLLKIYEMPTRDGYHAPVKILSEDQTESIKYFSRPPDDLFLLQFLRTKKYMMDRVFTTFENCILAQKKYSKWFDWQENDYEKMMELYRCGYIYPLAERDEEGRKLIFIQLRKLDPDYFTAADAIR